MKHMILIESFWSLEHKQHFKSIWELIIIMETYLHSCRADYLTTLSYVLSTWATLLSCSFLVITAPLKVKKNYNHFHAGLNPLTATDDIKL